MAIEDERKYLIKDKDTFNGILASLKFIPAEEVPAHVGIYKIRESVSKSREYRYFDTFERNLEASVAAIGVIGVGVLESEGSTTSIRARGGDYVITIKIPTEQQEQRKELEKIIPSAIGDFYQIDPLEHLDEEQKKSIQRLCGDRPLAEVVRLQVQTHRFNLYGANQLTVQVAVDDVLAESIVGIKKQFWELEIELMKYGTSHDKEQVAQHFWKGYGPHLVKSSLPKFNKAMRLMRGEEIVADAPV